MAVDRSIQPEKVLAPSKPVVRQTAAQAPAPTPAPTPEPVSEPVTEVAAVAPPVEAPVVFTTTKAPVVTQPTEVNTLDALLTRAKAVAQENGLGSVLLVERFKTATDRYFTKVAPGQMLSEKDGAFEQYLLAEALIDFLKNENEVLHRLLWNYYMLTVTKTFGKHYEMLNRFLADEWTYGKERYDFLLGINNLILWTADPATRAAGIKKIDPKYRFKGAFWNETAQANMARFYGV